MEYVGPDRDEDSAHIFDSSDSLSKDDDAAAARAQTEISPFKERLRAFAYVETGASTRKKRTPVTRATQSPNFSNTGSASVDRSSLRADSAASSPASEVQRKIVTPRKRKSSAGYATPSKYAHLSVLQDVLAPGLICVFVGVNPGIATAEAGHAYAHPSNMFWKLLHSSGCTDRRLRPQEDRSLPQLYSMGNTNIVERPTKDQSELSKEEMVAGTAVLDAKFLEYKPEAVVIVGKGIWEAIWKYRHGRTLTRKDFHYGWQEESENMGKGSDDTTNAEGKSWLGSRVFVATSTSGLSASLKPAEKEAIWQPLGEWVKQRRRERSEAVETRIAK